MKTLRQVMTVSQASKQVSKHSTLENYSDDLENTRRLYNIIVYLLML